MIVTVAVVMPMVVRVIVPTALLRAVARLDHGDIGASVVVARVVMIVRMIRAMALRLPTVRPRIRSMIVSATASTLATRRRMRHRVGLGPRRRTAGRLSRLSVETRPISLPCDKPQLESHDHGRYLPKVTQSLNSL
ncbi:hypothetical protein [Paraburkholderia sp. J12]|uniref:hypothetical protein n=1 Tax=Paraburkholderia sp. J12 TaxID=2805432 RepID=UPI002ABE1CD7|nr:hypothetical protein [Paraburkholderia sp. J12]